jgi:hypothetical protein
VVFKVNNKISKKNFFYLNLIGALGGRVFVKKGIEIVSQCIGLEKKIQGKNKKGLKK